ncbi:TPA: NAD-dependent epimerase/dehydratase family protein [Aeromonas hydrophila subsp. hydrophila]|uniref:UDP-2-acetamido-2,6-beta-L-arabino-hexul-4-ose reductase n=1 Tax=Aeromonas hydrophila TaxID=644 RepID=UPI00214EB737|nr:NAD-dependent epimerase/dehydratase family protein [Aeromonas hydrophila]MCR3951320.1 NAD-dependent epimerase/dehydratase family protein [Aeromonas hydrophila]HEB4995368.1 NAD-dependent epimerase/dehydratase family protein [Aeromonas hydrophila subsp. hydrophila]HEB5046608.1 NAD-dependent epimerase/dehydratase family protein [Aeromonas hydrophila subsp. hydrophila]
MKILVTGANGFIGKNLRIFLAEQGFTDVTCFEQDHSYTDLADMVAKTEFVFHLAGVNRPKDEIEFSQGNTDLTQRLVSLLSATGRHIPLVLTSSIQAERDNAYGKSKAAAEQVALDYMRQTGSPTYVYRLANVFGKWCRPNYNSAVATFCHNTVHDLPITIHDANAPLALVYIDDVCASFINLLRADYQQGGYKEVEPIYHTTVGAVAEALQKFKQSRINLITEEVGTGLMRALYATYLSYFVPGDFSYTVPGYSDPRGSFVEMLKTPSAGQFSFFTAHSGVTRGGHYHHTKNEKFLVIKGTANYRFKQIITGEEYSITVDAGEYKIIETVPGWTHDITNIGEEDLIVMLWANEIFDRSKPDTIASPFA